MKKKDSSTPSEIIAISSAEDKLLTSSIFPRQTNESIHQSDQSLRSWVGPLDIFSWTNLSDCMKFIAENSCRGNPSPIWMQRTLDRISSNAKPEQLKDILNGYADLYKLELKLIQINHNILVNGNDISTFGGTLSDSEQQQSHRNIAYMMYNSETFLFTTFYAIHSDGHPHTCFATDDERIIDDIDTLLCRLNREISQCETEKIDHINGNNDATTNNNESQTLDSLDALLPPEINSMAMHPNSSFDIELTENIVRGNLDRMDEFLHQAKHLQSEIEDTRSVETVDRQPPNDEAVKEQETISHSGMISIKKDKTHRAKKHIVSSNNHRSDITVCLTRSTTQPTMLPTSNEQSINTSIQLYDPPTVIKHPKRTRRRRYLSDLAKDDCPLVQRDEGKQRSYPETTVPSIEGLHLRVRAVTENEHPHPCTTVAPANASVDWTLMKDNNERICLQCDPDSFNPELECVYLTITSQERRKNRKKIKIRLFNWKQYGPTTKEIIARENLQLCRLEFCLCKRLDFGKYQLVSQSSYTTVIEESDGDVTIDLNKIVPTKLCELGGEKIMMPLSALCRKKDFSVERNGDKLSVQEFTMERKKLLINSPSKDEDENELHLIIKRTEYVKNTSTKTENTLYDDSLPYVPHGKCSPTCPHRTVILHGEIS